jgi:predicted Zn finger-like uncharacterized protein
MSLITRCPMCFTAFSVGADQLRAFEGLVRCGQCQHVFDGYTHLDATLPVLTEKIVSAPTSASSNFIPSSILPPSRSSPDLSFFSHPSLSAPPRFAQAAPSLTPQVIRSRQSDMPVQATHTSESLDAFDFRSTNDERVDLHSPSNSSLEPTLTILGESRMRGNMPSDVGREVPGFMVTGPTPEGVARVLWQLAAVLALLAISLQAIYVYRNDLAITAPALRPLLERACLSIGCEVQYPKHAERLSIQASSLQQEARNQEGSDVSRFKLRFTLQNRFDKPQSWPHLLVLLTDASGTVVVRKVVPPVDYVPRQLIDTPFKSQQEANFVVDLQVKGLTISGFEIDKFYP